VHALAARERGVHERGGQVQPTPGRAQHPLDQVPNLGLVEDRGGQLGPPRPRDEDLAGLVHPDLLDGRVVEVALDGAEAGDGVDEVLGRAGPVRERFDEAQERTLVVVRDGCVDQSPHAVVITGRVQPTAADEFADLALQERHSVLHAVPLSDRGRPLWWDAESKG